MTEKTTPNRPLIEQKLEYFGNEIQHLMSDYPCLREICKGLETAAYPAALFTGACFLGTLMTRCTYRFYHRPEELRRLNYGVYIIGDPGSGKSFATRLYDLLAGPIIRVSREGMNAMNRYKRKYSEWEHSGQKGDGPTKPKPLIRTHPARNSNKVFIEDMNNAIDIVDGEEMHLHMLSFDTELSNSIRLQSEAWNSKWVMELKAFHNEEDGECFVNNLLLPSFNVYWNYVYTGTPIALETKVNQRNIGTGLATRLAAIPMPSTHFRMIKRETLEDVGLEPEEDKTLRMWAERLKSMVNCRSRNWCTSVMNGRHDVWQMPRTTTPRSQNSCASVWPIMASMSPFPSSSCATGTSGNSIVRYPSTTQISTSANWCATSNSAARTTSSATTGSRTSGCRNRVYMVLVRKGITRRR